jgi:hypothetical protein
MAVGALDAVIAGLVAGGSNFAFNKVFGTKAVEDGQTHFNNNGGPQAVNQLSQNPGYAPGTPTVKTAAQLYETYTTPQRVQSLSNEEYRLWRSQFTSNMNRLTSDFSVIDAEDKRRDEQIKADKTNEEKRRREVEAKLKERLAPDGGR